MIIDYRMSLNLWYEADCPCVRGLVNFVVNKIRNDEGEIIYDKPIRFIQESKYAYTYEEFEPTIHEIPKNILEPIEGFFDNRDNSWFDEAEKFIEKEPEKWAEGKLIEGVKIT